MTPTKLRAGLGTPRCDGLGLNPAFARRASRRFSDAEQFVARDPELAREHTQQLGEGMRFKALVVRKHSLRDAKGLRELDLREARVLSIPRQSRPEALRAQFAALRHVNTHCMAAIVAWCSSFHQKTLDENIQYMYNTLAQLSPDLMARSSASLVDRSPNARQASLIARVAQFYCNAFRDSPEGIRYLVEECGIRDAGLFTQFRIGLANGGLIDVLPRDDETVVKLKSIGVLTDTGAEYLRGCIVLPLCDLNGAIVSLCGVRTDTQDLRFLAEAKGLWNAGAAKRANAVLVTESPLDALLAIDAGLTETLFCVGEEGLSTEQVDHLVRCGVKTVGAYVSEARLSAIKDQLTAESVTVKPIVLPGGVSVREFLAEDRPARVQALRGLVGEKLSAAGERSATAVNPDGYTRTTHGFALRIERRSYEVKGIARLPTQLKATIKGMMAGAGVGQFVLGTIDLYSSRSREAFGKECVEYFKVSEAAIRADVNRLLELVEAWQPEPRTAVDVPTPSEAEQRAAEAFLRNPDLLTEILNDLETLGVTGEEINKLLCYLAAVSRKLDDPLSLLIQSRLAAGKSVLQNTVASLVPDEDKAEYTRLTSQALFYQDELSLVHKLLVLEEAEGLGEAAYSLRALQSAKHLAVATTTKDPITGRLRTDSYHVQGPIAVLLTTTRQSLDEETQSRFLVLTIDESAKMTETILQAQRHRDTLPGYLAQLDTAPIIAKHHTAQRLLEPLVVINPYAEQLTFPANGLRARRDHKKYLMLIKAVAFLFQKQRRVQESRRGDQTFRYIEVTPEDIGIANRLAQQVLRHSGDELSAPARALLALIHDLVKTHSQQTGEAPAEFVFTRRQIREFTGWSEAQIRTHVKELEDLEYLKTKMGSWGKEFRYELDAAAEKPSVDLVDPGTLRAPSR
jgi:hypothetical protein